MDSNKDEALRCVGIAKDAIASGDKQRALKFIGIAQRLNHNLSVDDLLAASENLESSKASPSSGLHRVDNSDEVSGKGKIPEVMNGEPGYTKEHVMLVQRIKRTSDHYEILGLEKSCSVEQIRKAYRQLSLRVHPDKNKAPGSEEAFKKVCRAFKCLSDDNLRRQYDQTGFTEGYESNQHYNGLRRRRRQERHMFEEDFDPDEIFRSFFGQGDMFRTAHAYRTRRPGRPEREDVGGTWPNLILLLQLLPFLLIIGFAYLPYSEPNYSLQRNYTYQFQKMTENYGVEFYVKSTEFDEKYPFGSPARANIETNVVKDYRTLLWRYCQIERQRRSWSRNLPTPHCDKLESLGLA